MSQEPGHWNIKIELQNVSQFRGTEWQTGGKIQSLMRVEPQTDNTHRFLYWSVWVIHMHASLSNWNILLLLQSFITGGCACPTLYDEHSVRDICKWRKDVSLSTWKKWFNKPSSAHARNCFLFFFSNHTKRVACLFAGFIHFPAGLTQGSFLHHGVRKRWNIAASQVQFLGYAAVV